MDPIVNGRLQALETMIEEKLSVISKASLVESSDVVDFLLDIRNEVSILVTATEQNN